MKRAKEKQDEENPKKEEKNVSVVSKQMLLDPRCTLELNLHFA